MNSKAVIRLQSARQDELDAVAYYAREAGLDVALRLTEALRDAYKVLADQPGIGSRRYGDLLGVENLRSRRLKRFPFLVFYVDREDHIEVWRVLHAQRDIPATLAEQTG